MKVYNMRYICECGKEFDNPQSFNGHKSHCVVHLNYYNKSFVKSKIEECLKQASKKGAKVKHEKSELKKLEELTKWVSEQHTCEKCGKVMTSKFGSGRFCSRACANSHIQTEEINLKRSNQIKNNLNFITKLKEKEKIYYLNPKRCKECNCILDYSKRRKYFCSNNCLSLFRKKKAIESNFGGFTKGSHGWGRGKKGYIKGIYCDSCLELIYVLYCKDNNIQVIRNNKYFEYYIEGKKHKYYPDFYLPDNNIFVEIKGADNNYVYEKIKAVKEQGFEIELFHKHDLKKQINYIKEKYKITNEHYEILYEK